MAKTDLTEEEREIVRQKRRMERAEERYIEARSKFREMVSTYVDNGGSPTKLARAFDPPITRGRIHQYRYAWAKEQEEGHERSTA